MRRLADAERIQRFMKELGRSARGQMTVYLTGGSSAVLRGWRANTVDVDMKMVPDRDEVYRALPALKESLELNIELACPDDFIPEVPGWQERSVPIAREGKISFYHYDFYAQALSKLERGHAQDLADVQSMVDDSLAEPARLLNFFNQIERDLYRYPAIDAASFRQAVESFVEASGQS
ncbi:MAG: hypothetical protein OER77_13955 [Myxococcales bacterium]|nr:hypothetical protein [Myxococcales bacterium]